MAELPTNEGQAFNRHIYAEQVRYLYANSTMGLLTTFINSSILLYVLWSVVDTTNIVVWLMGLWVITTVRYLMIVRHKQVLDQPGYDAHRWGRLFIWSIFVAGLFWGSVVFVAFPSAHFAHQIFIAFVIGGMAAGASSSLAYIFAVPMAFNLSSMVPVVGRMLYEGSEIQYAMALMLVLFLGMMLLLARRSHETFISSVRLGFEKSQLMDVYQRTQSDLESEMSERELVEASLYDSQTRLRTIIDNAPFVIFATDSEGQFVLSEGKGLASMNLHAGELVGQSIHQVFANEPEMLDKLVKTLAGEECKLLRHYKEHLYDVICTPLRDKTGRIIGMIGIETDVTEKFKMEKLQRELISTVSHELRTPLTSIIGALQLVTAGVVDSSEEKRGELLNSALRNSRRLIRLVNDILDIDKLESGKMQFYLAPVQIKALIEQAVVANMGYAEQFGVRLEIRSPAYDCLVNVDEERVLQVMGNLLSNAIKHTQEGDSVCVELQRARLLRESHNGNDTSVAAVQISVIDHGPGIPEDKRQHVFEKFIQINAERSLVQGGSGLGLSIAKTIVEQLGGRIEIQVNEKDRETRFSFTLPVWGAETV